MSGAPIVMRPIKYHREKPERSAAALSYARKMCSERP
ncbi:hypothetical protein TNCT_275261, partial [Trichonephila clavata]